MQNNVITITVHSQPDEKGRSVFTSIGSDGFGNVHNRKLESYVRSFKCPTFVVYGEHPIMTCANCGKNQFFFVPSRPFPAFCLDCAHEVQRDMETVWNPNTSVD